MKKPIIMTVIAACIALCAAVWPQGEAVRETPAPDPTPAVSAPEPPAAEPRTEVAAAPQAEKEKTEIPEQEPCPPVIKEPEVVSTESIAAPEPAPEPTPEPISRPEITNSQETAASPTPAITDIQPDDMVYVPGFGWLENQGEGEVIHDEMIYENGNKVGSMG